MRHDAAARLVGFVALALALGSSLFGCSKRSSDRDRGDLGSVVVALALPGGGNVSTVNYQITGNGLNPPIVGSIDVSAPGTTRATVLVSGLVPGTYTVTLSANTDNVQTCSGSAPFTVVAGQTALADVIVQCHSTADRGGRVGVFGRFDQCPFITSFSATTLQAPIGGSITVSAVASDPDPGDIVTYAWSASPSGIGTFAPNGATATFVCGSIGSAQLTISVTDGICGDTITNAVPVTCTSPVLGIAGGGGSGTGGGGGSGGTAGSCNTSGGGGCTFVGAGGTAGGSGGTFNEGGANGAGCIETAPPPQLVGTCMTCLRDNETPSTDGCCPITDPIGQNLCFAASLCMRTGVTPTGPCNQDGDTTTCLCGTNASTCDQVGQANGPCVNQITSAAGRNLVTKTTDSPTPAQVLSRFGDPAYALGRAANIQAVAGAFCGVECGYQPTGVGGTGGSTGTGGIAGTGGRGGTSGTAGTGGVGGAAGRGGTGGTAGTGGIAGTGGVGGTAGTGGVGGTAGTGGVGGTAGTFGLLGTAGTTGIGGFPDSCLETNPPPSLAAACEMCIVNNNDPAQGGCCPIFNTDPTGYMLCQTASACMRAGGPPVGVCNISGDTTTCLCGTNSATCDQPGQANGPCVAEITAAAARNILTHTTDTPTALQVIVRFGDNNYAIGRAANIQAVAAAFCPAECGF